MKGLFFFGIKGIAILIGIILIFGGALYDITVTGVRCGFALSGSTEYTCDEFYESTGKTLIIPDRNIKKGTLAIMKLRSYDNETLTELGIIQEVQEQTFRNQILLGLVGEFILFLFLAYIFIKLSPSSSIDLGSILIAILLAIVLMAFIQTGYSAFIEGEPEVPFSGLWTLLEHPEVLSEVVDQTAVLPGTLTPDEILNETNLTGGET